MRFTRMMWPPAFAVWCHAALLRNTRWIHLATPSARGQGPRKNAALPAPVGRVLVGCVRYSRTFAGVSWSSGSKPEGEVLDVVPSWTSYAILARWCHARAPCCLKCVPRWTWWGTRPSRKDAVLRLGACRYSWGDDGLHGLGSHVLSVLLTDCRAWPTLCCSSWGVFEQGCSMFLKCCAAPRC